MNAEYKEGFFANESSLNMNNYLVFDYYFESTIDPEEAAAPLVSGAVDRSMEACWSG